MSKKLVTKIIEKKKNPELKPGDPVAYTAEFLKRICDFSKASADRRGVFASWKDESYAYVHWDNEAELLKDYEADPEYCEQLKKNGALVMGVNICKVGSARFGDTYAN